MLEVSTSIEIDRPPDKVFDFVSEVLNNPRWQRGRRSCEWTAEPPLRVGSTFDQRVRFLGKNLGNSFEVVELEPGRVMKFASTGGSFPLTVTRRVIPLDETRSRFIEHVEGHLNRSYRIAEPLFRGMVRRTIERDFRRLKKLLESEAPPA